MNNQLHIKASLELPGFSFSVNETFAPGITGVFGHSGAGKSTLLQCISGVVSPDKGEIVMNGHKLFSSDQNSNIPINKRRVGYVFQEGRLFPHYTVERNLRYGTRFLKGRKGRVNFDQVVDMLEIRPLLHKRPSDISGGERQRVAIGRALLADPEVLLMDEPFSALDQMLRRQIIPFIARVAKALDVPVLLVSHDLPDILKLTNQICIMQKGQVLAHGVYEDLLVDSNLLDILPISETLNTICLEVKDINVNEGMITLNGMGPTRKINILFEPELSSYELGNMVKVFLKPDDIVLSTQMLQGTSFRNSLKGTVIKYTTNGAKVWYAIDCGFQLIAEVSRASQRELNLQSGQDVYCNFKTISLDSVRL